METIEQLRPLFRETKREDGSALTDDDLAAIAGFRHRCRTDHFYLGNQILDFTFQEDVHRALFDVMLQKDASKSLQAQDGIKRRLILWPRQHYKTSAEVVEIVQLILCWPNITILVVSGKQDLAKEILGMVKEQFEANAKLAKLFPEYCGKRLGKKTQFSVKCRKVAGTVRGGTLNISTDKSTKSGVHADAVFLDDLQHDKNYQTADLIEQAHKAYVAFSGPIMKDGGLLYVLGTRYVATDIYGQIIDTITHKGLSPLKTHQTYQITPTWQAVNQVSADGQWLVSVRSCWRKNTDEKGAVTSVDLLFPKREDKRTGELKGFTLENLLQIYRDDPVHFACQYENNPNPGGLHLYTEELFESCTVLWPQVPERGPIICIWDLAWSEKKKQDQTVGIAVRIGHDRRAYIIDSVCGRFDPTTQVKSVILLANRHKANKVYVEDSPGAKLLVPSINYFCQLNRMRGIPLEFVSLGQGQKAMKDIRISAMQPVMVARKILFFAGMANYEELKTEFVNYPSAPHDDFPDVVSRLIDLLPTIDCSHSEIDVLMQRKEKQAPPEPSPFGGLGGIING